MRAKFNKKISSGGSILEFLVGSPQTKEEGEHMKPNCTASNWLPPESEEMNSAGLLASVN